MDLHDVARGRGASSGRCAGSAASTLSFGISSDMLYPSYQQRQIDELMRLSAAAAPTSRSTLRTGTTSF